MYRETSGYVKEKRHAFAHFLVITPLTTIGFVLIVMTDKQMNPSYFLLKVLLSIFSIYSLTHYLFVQRFPNLGVRVRKFLLIILDLLMLTISIIIIGQAGLFLLPLYILIVMESGISFGFVYFYVSLFLSSASWVLLVTYSYYWQIHSDTVAIFAITTFLIPLVYLKQMMNMHQKHDTLNEKLESTTQEANYDALTGLPNRKYYDEYMKQLLKERTFFALLFIDLNKFKTINDTHGHDVGDEVLREVAKRLTLSMGEDDMLARLGGDEFVIITKRKKVFLAKFLEKLEDITIAKHTVGDVTVLIELSIGISLFPDDSKSETFLRKYADESMYVAKKRRDTYHVFYEEIKSSEDSF